MYHHLVKRSFHLKFYISIYKFQISFEIPNFNFQFPNLKLMLKLLNNAIRIQRIFLQNTYNVSQQISQSKKLTKKRPILAQHQYA